MKKIILAAAVVGASAIASAQVGSGTGTAIDTNWSGIGFRLGAGFPLDNSLRDVADTWVNFGIDYDFDRSVLAEGTTYISFDWFARGLNGDKGNFFPIAINQRFYSGPATYEGRRSYWFVGLGGNIIDVSGGTSTRLFARGGLGMQLSDHLYAEAAGYLTQKTHGVAANIISVSIGYRF